jgi:hypothetical protein
MFPMTALRLLVVLLIGFLPDPSWAFDWRVEGRVIAGSSYVFESPPNHKDFDSEAELRLGVLGNAVQKDTWALDYEVTADARLADGPSVQSGLRDETDVDFFRAWLRMENEKINLRGGRQKILFGAGAIFRPTLPAANEKYKCQSCLAIGFRCRDGLRVRSQRSSSMEG